MGSGLELMCLEPFPKVQRGPEVDRFPTAAQILSLTKRVPQFHNSNL